LLPLTANDVIDVLVNPVFIALHETPLLVERNTPPLVPANRLVPITANDAI
jgi:hypothetical protein